MDCTERYQRLYLKIDEGLSRFRAETGATQFRRELQRYRGECSVHSADFLDAFFKFKFQGATIQDTANALRAILTRKRLPQFVELDALFLLARVTLHVDTIDDNESYRQRALDIAVKQKWRPRSLRVLVNWAFALIEAGYPGKAAEKVRESELVLTEMKQSDMKAPEVLQSRSRLLAHQAKLLILDDRELTPARAAEVTTKALRMYQDGIELVRENDHLRVNQQIEACEYVVKCYERLDFPPELDASVGNAELIITEAQRSLDSHNCDYCRAYFGEIYSRLLFAKGKRIVNSRPSDAEALWETAATHARESLSTFEYVGHVEARVPRQTLDDITAERERLPRKVFLSHSSRDKILVRDVKEVLEKLHYETWLDVDHLLAGDKLEMGLREAFRNSCAVVFFITTNFRDKQYLQSEIEYAIAEKRKRGDGFHLISLLFTADVANPPQVPALLEPFVYKKVDNPLDALRYIIDSLPFEPGTPTRRR